MKLSSMRKAVFVVIILAFCAGGETASASVIKGSGGDSIAIEFKNIGLNVVAQGEARVTPGFDIGRYPAFREAVLSAQILTTNKTLLLSDGGTKCAVNFPDKKRILINRACWNSIASFFDQVQLVVHEYLSVAGIDDSKYLISYQVLRTFDYKNPISSLLSKLAQILASPALKTDNASDLNHCFDWGLVKGELQTAQAQFAEVSIWLARSNFLSPTESQNLLTLATLGFPSQIESLCSNVSNHPTPEAANAAATAASQFATALTRIQGALESMRR